MVDRSLGGVGGVSLVSRRCVTGWIDSRDEGFWEGSLYPVTRDGNEKFGLTIITKLIVRPWNTGTLDNDRFAFDLTVWHCKIRSYVRFGIEAETATADELSEARRICQVEERSRILEPGDHRRPKENGIRERSKFGANRDRDGRHYRQEENWAREIGAGCEHVCRCARVHGRRPLETVWHVT